MMRYALFLLLLNACGMEHPNLLTAVNVAVIAHRGQSSTYPENTLPSFIGAGRAGADFIELDYHHSKDGIPVVIHDSNLKRTTNIADFDTRSKYRVMDHDAGFLQQLDAGSYYSEKFSDVNLPLLEDALAVTSEYSKTLIERKSGDARTCLNLLERMGLLGNVVIQSFDWRYLSEMRSLNSEIELAVLGNQPLTENLLKKMKKLRASTLNWSAKHLSRESVALAHAYGFKVWVYTINSTSAAERFVAMGIDGIVTDRPGELGALPRLSLPLPIN
jgi:glycerophosphoryl diester phosphodiesterase